MILISFGDELCHGNMAPRDVAKSNSLKFIDMSSKNATSNLAIYKSIVKTVADLKATDDYIFLIGWTRTDRIQYRYEGKDIVFIKDKYKHDNRMYDKLNKFNHYLFEPTMINQQRMTFVYATQQVLESKNIKYYMYNTAEPFWYHRNKMIGLKNINSRLYHNPLSEDSTMLGYIKKQKLDIFKGQQAWAAFLSQKMKAAGVLEK